MIKSYTERAKTVNERINEIAMLSGDEQNVTRIFGTQFFLECSTQISEWMRGAGLETCIDNIGNIRGKLKSKNSNAKTFVIGSHFDSVKNGGKYEGILGILSGLDVIDNIIQKNISLPFHLELIAFASHEADRFNYSYLGSHVVAGSYQNKLLEIKDEEGKTLSEVLQSLSHNPQELEKDAVSGENLLGYFEIHTEQGNVLYDSDIPVGVVSSIRGQKRIEIKFAGKAGHAGTIAMSLRKDALAAAAKFILAVEKYAIKEKKDLLATIGKVTIPDAASNVIPGTVFCTLDIRSDSAELLSDAYEFIYSECENICDKRNIYFEWKLIQETDPVVCNKKFKRILSNCIIEKKIPLIEMVSGAGHDAAIMSSVTQVAMLFVKCLKNVAENPPENVEINDIATTLEISDQFIQLLAFPPEKLLKKKENN